MITNIEVPKDSITRLRTANLKTFSQQGLPARTQEDWKYTDIGFLVDDKWQASEQSNISSSIDAYRLIDTNSHLMVFVNGYFHSELSTLQVLPSGVIITDIVSALNDNNRIEQFLESKENVSALVNLNSALFQGGAFIYIPKNIYIDIPIHILSIVTGAGGCVVNPRHIVIADENAQAVIIEEYRCELSDPYWQNAVMQIKAGPLSKITHYKIQAEDEEAVHTANTLISQKEGSELKTFNLTLGAKLSRDDLTVLLKGKGANCKLNGLYLAHKQQHCDHHTHVDHLAQRTISSEVYKGILADNATAVFNGKIIVQKDAKGTAAHQANHNLLLSKDARINTKPELQIYSDDIKCSHGATVGQIDPAALYYLRSRGISEQRAMDLLKSAFASEVLQMFDNEAIYRKLNNCVDERLSFKDLSEDFHNDR